MCKVRYNGNDIKNLEFRIEKMETRNAKSEKRKQVAAGGGGKAGRGEKGRLKAEG